MINWKKQTPTGTYTLDSEKCAKYCIIRDEALRGKVDNVGFSWHSNHMFFFHLLFLSALHMECDVNDIVKYAASSWLEPKQIIINRGGKVFMTIISKREEQWSEIKLDCLLNPFFLLSPWKALVLTACMHVLLVTLMHRSLSIFIYLDEGACVLRLFLRQDLCLVVYSTDCSREISNVQSIHPNMLNPASTE